jgi:hypothetical protein
VIDVAGIIRDVHGLIAAAPAMLSLSCGGIRILHENESRQVPLNSFDLWFQPYISTSRILA